MKTLNPFRKKKIDEIQVIYDLYPDLALHERLFMVLDEMVRKAIKRADFTELSSIQELAKVFEKLFINPKTGKPNGDAIRLINRIITKVRKDPGHPHLRPYTEPHVELLADGTEVVRNYLNLLRGSKAVQYVNAKLEKVKAGLTESQDANKDLLNVKKVIKEADQYRAELEAKQQQANRKKFRKK